MTCITEIYPAFQPLYYVLLFPPGEHGWHPDIPLTLADGEAAFIPGHHEDEDLYPGEEPDNNENNDTPSQVGQLPHTHQK